MAQYQSTLTGPEIDAALQDMAQHDSEAWAVGTRDGAAVTSLDITYENNAKYYSDNAMGAAARAEAAVPAGTAGAVFFDQAQALSDSQKAQARANIGAKEAFTNVLQLSSFVAIGSAEIPGLPNATTGWYRIADIDKTGLTNAPYNQVLIMTGGYYGSGIPTEFVISASLPTYSNSANAKITQLGGVAGTNYTQIRFSSDSGIMHIEVYLALGGTGTRGPQRFFIATVGGKLVTYAPTEPISTSPATINATYTIQTVATGAVQTS
ncbi:MAG: hypothetical protein IKF99_08660 [Oscillospiraceae bacterium]|nr:hypothetical protein [Oscillospiraceae bacterium]